METTALLDYQLIAEIKRVGRASGRHALFSEFVRKLESELGRFGGVFSECIARGDARGAVRAAHTLKGSCRQLGAHLLGDLFAAIERSAKAGRYAEARREFEENADLIAQCLEALKRS